ncbi:RAD51-associated protein 1 [Sorex fumeus]|uniref:RAD51-associated protein 1 n=1 Tax=Sorex fumeus TaxID=62283 RepID=UPI0024ADF3B3|nr:RAD51-associated protein 1 [Sorex fumeus]
MVRPQRHKKSVDYSQFNDSDSDDDFVAATAPLNKKPKTKLKEEKPNPKLKTLQKEDIAQEETPKKRMALDDKLYKRDLEVALALSVKELPTTTVDLTESPDKSVEKLDSDGVETKSPHISNCSVAGDYLDLDKITEEEDLHGVQGKRKAASKAVAQQRMMLLEGSDGERSEESEPDFATGEESEDDSDFGESDDEDENFTVRKSKESKAKDVKKKEAKVKPPVEKREKKPRSKCKALATSVVSAPAAVKAECLSPSKTGSLSSAAPRTPLQTHSSPAASKRPRWVPPAASGSSSGGRPPAAVSMKSPSQSLRLGLSRLARVKPLHPNATSV